MADTLEFWKGDFGDSYTRRNRVEWEERVWFWADMLLETDADSLLEVGCNAGWNFDALRSIDRNLDLIGCDVNHSALLEAAAAGFRVCRADATEVGDLFPEFFDVVFTSGVLIHVAPDDLEPTMSSIMRASKRYVLAVEYEAEEETEIDYRGHSGKLWKRPFGKLYKNLGLELVSYGEAQGFDRCHYWLFEKAG